MIRPIDKVLIANRGEIACRVIRTLRRMHIRSVAVYSDADRHALHVRMADEARHIGPPPASESYLKADQLIAMAVDTGCQAIHPGYGFLSENPTFAERCEQAGIKFIGPSSRAIAAMGSKSAAKVLMADAGVPLIPGYHGEDQTDERLLEEAKRVGFPLLIKAAFGGGGKGMRVVHDISHFIESLHSCRREASASFGNASVLVERYLTQPRHVEIQVFCDSHGNGVHLFERDCSIQRRHQKIIEEAPAPGMTDELRQAMGSAAVAAAKAIDYEGAGTIEFLLDVDGRFYFMEMNTRLQVEHPVTEYITGLDLVEWQIRVARGEVLPRTQSELTINGHAMEVRICAESPSRDFMPSIGRLQCFRPPATDQTLRLDTGIEEGSIITPYYDPMVAKLIVHGRDREEARKRMLAALSEFQVIGIDTNIHYLSRIMSLPAFAAADLSTRFLSLHGDGLSVLPTPSARDFIHAALILSLSTADGHEDVSAASRPVANSPWNRKDGWLMNAARQSVIRLSCGDCHETITITTGPDHVEASCGEESLRTAASVSGSSLQVIDTRRHHILFFRSDDTVTLFADGHPLTFRHWAPEAGEHEKADAGHLAAPMPGRVIQVLVSVGQSVKKGEVLVIMEAMKMEHSLRAPFDGVVASLPHKPGDAVREGTELASLTAAE
jgi:3-methylcrotonyl-CoA carboxylase alpha subunit